MTVLTPAWEAEEKPRGAVLVTGASTGIGRKITECLAANGCLVYAGARRQSDLHALGSIENVQPLRLDVTSPGDVATAVDVVVKSGVKLHGLVNNAGVATLGPTINGNDKEFDLVMTVNVYGPYRITKAFAPLIVGAKGRIVMIGSITGIISTKNGSAYSMSKHAIEAFTDSLALEMEPLGVHVSVVEPGDFNTRIGKSAVERTGDDSILSEDRSKYKEPDDVAAAVVLALFEPRPKRRYLVVSSEHEAQITLKKQIEQLVQLNEGHRYTYDRDALIGMLDDALGQTHLRRG